MQHAKLQALFARLAKTGAAWHAGGQPTRWNFDGITDFVHPLPHSDLGYSYFIYFVQTVDVCRATDDATEAEDDIVITYQ